MILIFTIGVCTGAGFGLIYLPAIVSVTCYFDKKRAFATGIAVCGSGIGSVVFAPLTEFLIVAFGWRGAMIVVAALVACCSIFGILFRPIDYSSDMENSYLTYSDDIEGNNVQETNVNAPETETEEDDEEGIPEEDLEKNEMPEEDLGIDFSVTDQGVLSERRFSEPSDESNLILQAQQRLLSDHHDLETQEDQQQGSPWLDSCEGISISVPPMASIMTSLDQDVDIVAGTVPPTPTIFSNDTPQASHQNSIRERKLSASGRRIRKKGVMKGNKSDVCLKIRVTDFDGMSASCRGLSSAPVSAQPDSPTRHSFCTFKANSSSRVHKNNSLLINRQNSAAAGSVVTTTTTSSAARESRCQNHHHHAKRQRKTSGPSGLFLERQDIFYSRSTLNLQQQPLQFKSNPILYSVSSSAVSNEFRKAILKDAEKYNNQVVTPKIEDEKCSDLFLVEEEPVIMKMKPKKTVSIDVEEKKEFKRMNAVEEKASVFDHGHGNQVVSSSSSSCSDEEEEESSCCPKEIISTFRLMVDFKILSNPIFLLFAISNFITSLGYYVPHIYLKDMVMTSLGEDAVTESQATNLIGLIGIGSTVGRLLFGFLSDHAWVNRLTLYSSCLAICGLCIMLSTFSTTYFSVAFCSTTFGLFCGEFAFFDNEVTSSFCSRTTSHKKTRTQTTH